MRTLGLDVGTHRVGVAVADETALIAQPLTTLASNVKTAVLVAQIRDLCAEHEVDTIVVGLPLSLSGGGRGESSIRARELGTRLESDLGVKIVYWDERFTTAQAERMLIGARVRRKGRREVVDKIAAALILQSYLDSRTHDD